MSQKFEENTEKFDYSKNQDLIDNMNKAQKNQKELEQEWFELERLLGNKIMKFNVSLFFTSILLVCFLKSLTLMIL